MQVRVCPKCGRENKPTNTLCANCYATIENVPVSVVKDKPAPVVPPVRPKPAPTARPDVTAPKAAGPAVADQSERTREVPPPNPYAPPMQTPRPAPYPMQFREEKKSDKTGAGIIAFLVLLVVCAIGYTGWWFYSYFTRPLNPDEVVQRLSDPLVVSDFNKLKKYLSQSTIDAIVKKYGSEQEAAKQMKGNIFNSSIARLNGQKTQTGKTTYENENTALVEIIQPENEARNMRQLLGRDVTLQVVVVRENKQWKVDVVETVHRWVPIFEEAIKKQFESQFKSSFPQQGGTGFPQQGAPAFPQSPR